MVYWNIEGVSFKKRMKCRADAELLAYCESVRTGEAVEVVAYHAGKREVVEVCNG